VKTRGVRGAITAAANDMKSILEATERLINEIMEKNDVKTDDICFIMFSATSDINAAFPARAAREMGLGLVPLLDVAQLEVEGSLKRCIRVLMVFNTDKKMEDIKHIYLEEAVKLRPDLAK